MPIKALLRYLQSVTSTETDEKPKFGSMRAFISYPSERVDQAREVRNFLTSVECPYWWDKENLVGGQDWDRSRKEAQAQSDVILLLCAMETVGRDGVYQREINEAIEAAKDKRRDQIYIICLRLDEVSLPAELSRLPYIDLFSPGWKSRLARSLKIAFSQRSETAPASLEVASAVSDDQAYVTRSACHRAADLQVESTYVLYELIGSYWDYVNAEITVQALQSFFWAQNWKPLPGATGSAERNLDVTEYFRKGELVSLTVSEGYYFAGAAHPNHAISTMNFFGRGVGKATVESLFDHRTDALDFLRTYTELDIKRQYLGTDDPIDISHIIKDAGWAFFSQFNLNTEGLIFNFTGHSLPHVFGYVDMYVPFDAVRHFLADEPCAIIEASRAKPN